MRKAKLSRKTAETDISVEINIDGTGDYDIKTGAGFFDHMLDQLSRHSLIDMKIRCDGDLHIDAHHTSEDFSAPKVGDYDTELFKEFFQAFSQHAGITLHVTNHYGDNNHHIAETCFKAVARVLRTSMEIDPRQADRIPSTKGSL